MKKTIYTGIAVIVSIFFSFATFARDLTPEEQAILQSTKQEIFGGLTFQLADQVQAGQIEPLMDFKVKDSLFINWIIEPEKVQALESTLNLPEGFKLAPIRLLKREFANYYLSLNIYEVNISEPAIRAEWSVYVTKGDDPTPRFMVVEALSSADAFDPTMGPVPAADVTYSRQDGQVSAKVNVPGTQLELTFDEDHAYSKRRVATLEWAKANDFIYWLNGVADKAFYNDTLTEQAAKLMKTSRVNITDNTRWAQFVKSKPKHVLIYDEPLEFALNPWNNLNDESLVIDPALKGLLQAVKPEIFANLTRLRGSQVITGQGEGIFDFTVDNVVPSYFMNFQIPVSKVAALAERLDLPTGLHLVPVSVFKYQIPCYTLSLNVYQGSGVAAGYRAEWSVYVASEENPDQPYFMVIDAATSNPSLDPVNLFTPGAQTFEYSVDSTGVASTEIVNGSSSFSASFHVPTRGFSWPFGLSQEWVKANDRVYWLNGVYDRLLYNSLLTQADATLIDPRTIHVSDNTPWAEFVYPFPREVFVFKHQLEYKIKPWYNVEELLQ